MTNFAAPMTVSGRDKANKGDVLVTQTATIDFEDTTKDLFTLPAPSRIIEIYVDVTTAFDATVTNLLDLGISGDATLFADGLALGSAGRVLASSDASQLDEYLQSDGAAIQGVYEQGGTAPTEGEATITVVYSVPLNLPD